MKVLVIRRDNIGDLVLTTPLFSLLKNKIPDLHLSVLVNSYNAPVLAGNPDVDEIFVYQKAKHRVAGVSRWQVWADTARQIWRMRQCRFDMAILAGNGYVYQAEKFARLVGIKKMIGYLPQDGRPHHVTNPVDPLPSSTHHAQVVMNLATALGFDAETLPAVLLPQVELRDSLWQRLALTTAPLWIGIHISARKPCQRWSVEAFAAAMHELHILTGAKFLLFWSPGAEDHPAHPGDDGKAERLLNLCAGLAVVPVPTIHLSELIAGLSLCDVLLCSDGGAMHVAAALKKPLVALFGDTDARVWGPWQVSSRVLQPESRHVRDISVNDVVQAMLAICGDIQAI